MRRGARRGTDVANGGGGGTLFGQRDRPDAGQTPACRTCEDPFGEEVSSDGWLRWLLPLATVASH